MSNSVSTPVHYFLYQKVSRGSLPLSSVLWKFLAKEQTKSYMYPECSIHKEKELQNRLNSFDNVLFSTYYEPDNALNE